MATREEWVRHFEDVNGRKPSPEEFMEAKKEDFVIATEEEASQVSEQVENQQVDSSKATEEVSADSVADTQPDEAQVTLEEEAPNHMPELNLENARPYLSSLWLCPSSSLRRHLVEQAIKWSSISLNMPISLRLIVVTEQMNTLIKIINLTGQRTSLRS